MLDAGEGQPGERIESEELSTTTGTNVRFPNFRCLQSIDRF